MEHKTLFLNNSKVNNRAFWAAATWLRDHLNLSDKDILVPYFESRFNCQAIYKQESRHGKPKFKGVKFNSPEDLTMFLLMWTPQ